MLINKFLISIIIVPLFLIGCDMRHLNNKYEDINKPINYDINQLIGITYKDVEKIYGTPEKSIYYINKDDINIKNINNITTRDFYNKSFMEASYNTSYEFNSYINVSYKNGKVTNATYDNIDVINYNKCIEEDRLIKSDFKIEIFRDSDFISLNRSDLDMYQNTFIGKNINAFNKNSSVSCSNIIATDNKNNKILYFYPIRMSNIPTSSNNDENIMLVYTINDVIKNIEIIKKKFICELIIKDFN